MKKKLSTFNYQLSTLLAAIALAACQAEHTDIIIDNDAPIAFNIAIGGVDTRVATNNQLKSNWENGDAIGIFVHKGTSTYATNVKLTYNGTKWSGELYYAPSTDTDTYTFYAYYPYVDGLASITTTIPIDALNAPTHHLAATKTGVARGTTNVPLTFNHLLTLVQVDFDATQCYISPNLAVTLKGCCPTATYTLASPTPTIGTGTPAPIPMTRVGTTNTYRAMVPPQTIQQGTRMFTIQNDDLFQSQPLANDMTLSKGKAELFPMITNKDYAPLITNATFRNYCLQFFDSSGDGKLSYTEVMAATEIVVKYKRITTLAGIEHFKNLETLDCGNNQLTELPISGLTQLTTLYCYDNQLTKLPISGLTQLTTLLCYDNQLTELPISGLTQLTDLNCNSNQLTELPLSGLTQLTKLLCYDNPSISELDVSTNTALALIQCGNRGPALTVWVDPATILGQGGGKLEVQAAYTSGIATSMQDVTQKGTPVHGVTVCDKP